MKSLQEVAQQPMVRWGALVALLVGLTQFNTGLDLFYAKWNANKVAEAAQRTAVEAKETAEDVDEDFRKYLETQDKVATALDRYVNQQTQQMPNAPMRRLPLDYWTDEDGTCYQCDPNVSDCANSWDGWWRCPR